MPWPFFRKVNPSPITSLPSQPRTETSNSAATRFAFKLFRELSHNSESPNVFFSPVSVVLCLALVYEGASGETRKAIAKVLEVADTDADGLFAMVATLRASCISDEPEVTLECANSLWFNPRVSVNAEYIAKAIRDYQAEIRRLESSPADAVAVINAWVNDKTHGKIKEIVHSLDALTTLIALNAIYFKGVWRSPFSTKATHEDWFHGSDRRDFRVPFMLQSNSFPYYETERFQAALIPYKSSRFGMYVFLPSTNSTLKEFVRHLDSGTWERYLSQFKSSEVMLKLPRFQSGYQANLRDALSRLGMQTAFDPECAEFDGIHPRPPEIWLDRVVHRSFLEVTEQGTEAAAVTYMPLLATSSMRHEPDPVRMVVDRPFFFAICDLLHHATLFMGMIGQPVSTN